MGASVKLLGTWSCPYVNRAQLALCLKSIDYEFIEENTLQKSEMLLKSNPVHKKIPVLIHGDKSVCESRIIVEYIGDAFATGPSILPSDAYDHALARFWAAYIDDKVQSSSLPYSEKQLLTTYTYITIAVVSITQSA